VLDLVLPLECGGCGAPSTRWCHACATELKLKPDDPRVIVPRVDPQVPVFSLGHYAGVRRQAIVAVKERGRADLITPLSHALGAVDRPLTLVPAPTRRFAARRRGGDPVTKIATAAADCHVGIQAIQALRMRGLVRDSVGLSITARQRNIRGRVRLHATITGQALVVDDIVTTGATAAESVRILRAGGALIIGVLAIAHA
jgi:predicted amidophosphoribosyltransferase